MLKEQKGITLVALIITIIVMLILAGVSISLVVGDNGVLTQAQDVNPKQLVASAKEAVALANADIMSAYYSNTASADETSGLKPGVPETYEDILDYINANYGGVDLVLADEKNGNSKTDAAVPLNAGDDADDDTKALTSTLPTKSKPANGTLILKVPGAQLDGWPAEEIITLTIELKRNDGLYSISVN